MKIVKSFEISVFCYKSAKKAQLKMKQKKRWRRSLYLVSTLVATLF